MTSDVCPICNRSYGGKMESHHLKPVTFRSRSKKVHDKDNRVTIHQMCHQKIHATFSEKELYYYYHTIERLLEHKDISTFIKWISSKPVDFYSKTFETKSRKLKRRR